MVTRLCYCLPPLQGIDEVDIRYFMKSNLKKFFEMESAGGIILVVVAALAMIIANSALGDSYQAVLHSYIGLPVPHWINDGLMALGLRDAPDFYGLSVSHWINDGLMAIFFLHIGLEVKRELLVGALRTKETAIFPAIAAVGGMLAPAAVYAVFNFNNPESIHGWAIPAATDIAFALGVLALLGSRVPTALKVFLLALAIIDDLGVIVIIALFYSSDISILALVASVALTALLFIMHKKKLPNLSWYLLVGGALWFAVLQSGIHATLAGVILGFAIPLEAKDGSSPLKHLEHSLHPYVTFLILPIFAFANAGVPLEGVSLSSLTSPVPMGIALGLLLGKPLGVFTFSYFAVKKGMAKLPEGVCFKQIFAVAVLCGIGFTMSIFISTLAFNPALGLDTYARLGILIGSTFSAILGYSWLNYVLPKKANPVKQVA